MVLSRILQKLCDQHPYLIRKDVKKILQTIFNEISEAICYGQNVEIRGFGTFKSIKRKARIGRNPKNSQSIQIPEKNAIKWKMSKKFFNELNKNFTESKISDKY